MGKETIAAIVVVQYRSAFVLVENVSSAASIRSERACDRFWLCVKRCEDCVVVQ